MDVWFDTNAFEFRSIAGICCVCSGEIFSCSRSHVLFDAHLNFLAGNGYKREFFCQVMVQFIKVFVLLVGILLIDENLYIRRN